MQAYKREFIDFMVRCDVLTFGDFTAKSGRKTPYFVNAGRYRTGAQIARLGRFYAEAIVERGLSFEMLFGPAYKGIPLAVATAIALCEQHGRDVAFCFNRKETKDHGEGGRLVGHMPVDGDRVVFVEDVTTAGTSIRETVPLLRAAARVELVALVVGVDRMERGRTDRSALQELRQEYGMDSFAVVTVDEIMEHLQGRQIDGRIVLNDDNYAAMQSYRAQYGSDSAS
jgi:orotate phosphoribosyltransferase